MIYDSIKEAYWKDKEGLCIKERSDRTRVIRGLERVI